MAAEKPQDIDLAPLSFLIVDDNQHMIFILRELLRAFGASQIHEARDAADAFELVRSVKIDFAIVDFLMEPLDGLDFTRLTRTASDSANKTMPIILLTAHTERSKIYAARDAGASDVVRKPVSAQVLYQRIQTILQADRKFVADRKYVGPCRRRRAMPINGQDRRKHEGAS
ncbi:MAG: response regulator [Alphaproteobacteria bacterium]|nr:two-component system response regulator [Rhodobiaceae bacterium]MBO6544390.1 response regulator [Alphaproteobacteria bacterium]MBO6628741.1 response regulator [Alphaproteobacteria bacterium]MDF1627377.1 response regulator [Parvibaculaceae bacterium]HAM74937.1 two-component system response regulator [Alcanivorax sp.]|tara:strand:+ start:760 stop:1272 length:513 start_codon:yes stop_codon:yes gene_type:complete